MNKKPSYMSKCPHCKNKSSYSEKWDAFYCKHCNEWLEKKCSEVKPENNDGDIISCYFNCWERPNTPEQENIKQK